MKSMKLFSFWLAMSVLGMTYAEENGQLFIGQIDCRGETKVAFVLELVNNDLEYVINEHGELYLKVDRIVQLPKDLLLLGGSASPLNLIGDSESVPFQLCGRGLPMKKMKMWQCPHCNHWWEVGESCKNPNCPTNQQKKQQ